MSVSTAADLGVEPLRVSHWCGGSSRLLAGPLPAARHAVALQGASHLCGGGGRLRAVALPAALLSAGALRAILLRADGLGAA